MIIVLYSEAPRPPEPPRRSLLGELVSQFYGAAVLGLEYVLEVRLSKCDETLKCALCTVDSDLTNILSHLLSTSHRVAFLVKHFPSVARRFQELEVNMEVNRWSLDSLRLLDTVAGRIVSRFGLGQPTVVSSLLSWERDRVNILRSVERADHARSAGLHLTNTNHQLLTFRETRDFHFGNLSELFS